MRCRGCYVALGLWYNDVSRMRLFSQLIVFSLLIAGFVLLALPVSAFPSFYDVRYMGTAAVLGAFIIAGVPRFFRVSSQELRAQEKNRAADIFQFWLAFAIATNALGDLGLYQLYRIGIEFDKMVHFGISLIAIIMIPAILGLRFEIRKSRSFAAAIMITLIVSVGWEAYEYAMDRVWLTRLSGVNGFDISRDTKFDIVFDVLGVMIGTAASMWRSRYSIALRNVRTATG